MNIYVGNLSWTMTEDDLRSLFEQYGTVSSVKIVKDRETGRSRGFGWFLLSADHVLSPLRLLRPARPRRATGLR